MFRQWGESPVARGVGLAREWSVTGLGVGLLAVSGSYLFVDSGLDATELIRLSIPVALSLFVVALGLWLRSSDLRTGLVGVVCLWSVAGGVVMGLLAGWVALLQGMEGRPMLQPASIVLTKVSLGTFGGGLLGVYHTRLRSRTAQLAEQRNRLDEFAGIVSHDLRNPLNVAQGHLELANETGADHHFEAVTAAHGRMERLVEEVLTLSRDGEMVSEAELVEIDRVARQAWTTVDTTGLTLRVETDRVVAADARRLRALFENLFRNAVEHGSTSNRTSSDDAVEHGSTSQQASPADAVEHGSTSSQSETDETVPRESGIVVVGEFEAGFFVADDGPGIPESERERVFEGGYSTASNGTGFGLAIVRRIAEAHDWRIRVAESESGGARFEFVGAEDAT